MKLRSKKKTGHTAGIFYRQMAAMVAAGVPVDEALSTVAREGTRASREARSCLGDDKAEQDLFKRVFQYLESHRQPNQGIADILYKVADEIDKYREFRTAFSQIFFIPVMTLVIGGFMLAVMMIFVVPVWQEMYHSVSAQMPEPTRFALEFSSLVSANSPYIALAIFLLIFLAAVKRKYLWTLFGQLPMVRPLFMQQSMVRFTRCLAVLLHIETPVKEAAALAAGEIRNPVYARKLKQALDDMSDKRPLSRCLQSSGWVTPVVSRIIGTGEVSGTLARTLGEVSLLYEKEADIALARTVYWVDIAIKLTVGVIVGFFVLSMYLPIFRMADTVM